MRAWEISCKEKAAVVGHLLELAQFLSMVDSVRTPPIKKGWMTKQGRGGLVKNWKKRYFVLMAGKIFYYVNEAKEYPYGEALKVDWRC